MRKILLILLLFLSFFSCRKTIDCIGNTGKKVIYQYEISDFDTLVVNNNFEINLVQDTVNKLIVSAYKKYADALTYSISDNSLFVDDTYNCKFTKPKKNKIRITLHVKRISLIRINAPSKIISEMPLINSDEIGVIVIPKIFEADLNVNCRVFYFWNTHLNGGKMFLHGNSEYLKLWNTSLCAVDASDLNTQNAYIENNSKGDITVKPEKFLSCKILNSGNVYYIGNPETIILDDTLSSGKLIKLN